MTKKLFVVLVVITAMLVSFSLVMAAKKAPRGTPEPYVKQTIGQKQTATPMPRGSVGQALEVSPLPRPISTAAVQPDKIPGAGPSQHSYEGVKVLQGGETCETATVLDPLPHTSTGNNIGYADDYEVQGEWSCPYSSTSGDVVYSYAPSADECIDIDLLGSSYDTKVFVYENTCVNPSYACDDDYHGDYTSAIMGLDIYAGNTYYIVVDGYGGDEGEYLLNVSACVDCDVVCPEEGIPEGEPVCYDEYDDTYNGGCNSTTPIFQDVNCGDVLCGTSGTYLFAGSNYRDTDWYRVVVAEDADLSWKVVAEFDVLIFIIDAGTEDCVDYTILGNTTAAPCDTAFLSFSVTAGVYWLWVGPSVFSGWPCGAEYVGWVGCEEGEPSNECDLQHDNGSVASYFATWVVGDEQAAYFDPAAECIDCDPVYPLHITQVEGYFYDPDGAGTLDVIVHFYEAGDPCMGPGAEIYSFAATVTDFYQTGSWATIPLPEVLCLEEDFFLAIEYNSDPGVMIPSLLFDSGAPVDTCIQWNYREADGGWTEWWDFWQTPSGVGWLMLSATGTCNDLEACYEGEECYMSQDQGNIAWINSAFEEGDQVVKYYNPEDYCEAPVYPYNIQDIDFLFYDMGAGSVPVVIHVYLECQDSCDGPGTEIFVSDPFVPELFGAMAHLDFDQPICVYEPFYIGWEYLDGVPGTTPSPLMVDGEIEPAELCHAWFYKVAAGFWIEHWDFWNDPVAVGYPVIRVSGYTEAPDCDPPPCDTTLETLFGGQAVQYFFKQPTNDQFMNMQFEMPADHGGSLEGFEVAFYDYEGNPSYGTPDPDLYVWLSDGTFPLDNNPPYQAIAEFHMLFGDIVWFPGMTYFDAYPLNLIFDAGELFHIGGSHAHEAGDTLAWLGCAVDPPTNRASAWDGSMWDDFGAYEFIIHAIICPIAPDEPTFSMRCTPGTGYATPGDPPVDVFQVEVGAVIGYAENVTLSLLSVSPPDDITATFNPNGIPPDFVSDVAIAVGAGVPYDSYTLTFQGVGDDGQTKTCDVTLIAQPPYDEGVVAFYHGFQRSSNFGLVGSDVHSPNFEWNGSDPLFAGTIVSAMTWPVYDEQEEHMHLVYGGCDMPFTPTQHMTITDYAGCAGDPTYEELYGEVAYSNFYAEPSVIPGEWDSLFVIGLRDVECTDFSIKIKIYYNPTQEPVEELWAALFEDWDVNPGSGSPDWGDMDTLHNLMYQYNPDDDQFVFGAMSVPFYDQFCNSMVFLHHQTEVYPTTADSCIQCDDATPPQPGGKYLFKLMSEPGYRYPGYWSPDPDDRSILITSPPFSLNPGEKHIEIWIDFGRDLADGMTWEQWYMKILRYVGMYRGDVNASDSLELPQLDVSDLVYLINYLYKEGPPPLPFTDQGNVDGKGPYGAFVGDQLDYLCPKNNVDVADLVYLINYCYKGGPPPVDYVRYIEQFWSRPSLFENPNW